MRLLPALVLVILNCQVATGQPDPKALVAKFRKTIGAEDQKASLPFLIQFRGERYFYALRDGKLQGESFPFDAKFFGITGERNKHRKEIETKIGVVPLKAVEVIDGGSGWYQFNEGEAVAMSKAEVAARESRELHGEVFLGRETLDSKIWQLSATKSSKVRGRDAWMFEAKASKIEPITLYFDKQSGLMLRLTTKTTDFAFLPGEKKPKIETFTRDLYFRDWKKFGPRMLPSLVEQFHDGVLWENMEPVNVSFLDRVDAKLFEAPKAPKEKK